MSRRLATIAKEINESGLGLVATIEPAFCNTDRKISGTRLRRPGRGRLGTRLIVKQAGYLVLDHSSAETYRHNSEVETWWERWQQNYPGPVG